MQVAFKKLKNQWLLYLISLAFFMEVIDITALNTSLPVIAHDLSVQVLFLKHGLVSYLLSIAICLPLSPYLEGRIGCKRLFILANAIFLLGSLGCAMAHVARILFVFRAVQGIGAAFLSSTARLIMVRIYKKDQLYEAQITAASVVSLGFFLGPLIGGAISTWLSWRWIFLINLPIIFTSLVFTQLYLNLPNAPAHKRRFSWVGFISLGLCLLSGLLCIELARDYHWSLVHQGVFFLFALMSGVVFIHYEKRSNRPLFNAKIWKQGNVTQTLIGSFILRMALMAEPFVLPIFLQKMIGLSAIEAGMLLSVSALGIFSSKRALKWMRPKFGEAPICCTGLGLLIFLMIAYAYVLSHYHIYALALILFLVGFARGSVLTVINVGMYQSLTDDTQSTGTTLNSMIIQLGASMAVSVSAWVLSWHMSASGRGLQASGFSGVFILEAVFVAVAFLIFLRINQRLKPSH